MEFYYGNERTKVDRNLFRRRDAPTVVYVAVVGKGYFGVAVSDWLIVCVCRLTTYGTLASEYGDGSTGKESPLFAVTWFRVVLGTVLINVYRF